LWNGVAFAYRCGWLELDVLELACRAIQAFTQPRVLEAHTLRISCGHVGAGPKAAAELPHARLQTGAHKMGKQKFYMHFVSVFVKEAMNTVSPSDYASLLMLNDLFIMSGIVPVGILPMLHRSCNIESESIRGIQV